MLITERELEIAVSYNMGIAIHFGIAMFSSVKPRYRIVLCQGENCNLGRRAEPLYECLSRAVETLNKDCDPPRVGLRTANCLNMCEKGPNLVLFPENIVFNYLTLEAIDSLVNDYLIRS